MLKRKMKHLKTDTEKNIRFREKGREIVICNESIYKVKFLNKNLHDRTLLRTESSRS